MTDDNPDTVKYVGSPKGGEHDELAAKLREILDKMPPRNGQISLVGWGWIENDEDFERTMILSAAFDRARQRLAERRRSAR